MASCFLLFRKLASQTVIDQTRAQLCWSSSYFWQKPDLKWIFNLVKYTQSCKCDLKKKNPSVSNSDIRDTDKVQSCTLFASLAMSRKLFLKPIKDKQSCTLTWVEVVFTFQKQIFISFGCWWWKLWLVKGVKCTLSTIIWHQAKLPSSPAEGSHLCF